MHAALGLAERGRGRTAPNPNVGCVIVSGDGRVVGRGWTQPGGRPHAEAMALAEAGEAVRGATVYVTLEPCAHESSRGPACADLLVAAAPARVVAAIEDPDPRTAGAGFARLRAAGIKVETGVLAERARDAMAGFLTRRALGRPFVTLKLATSLDGRIAMADGSSRWITGLEARAHVHLERSRHEAILVGRGTWEADRPKLDVRLPGLMDRSPQRFVLSSRPSPLRRHSRESGNPAFSCSRGDAETRRKEWAEPAAQEGKPGSRLRGSDEGREGDGIEEDDVTWLATPADIAHIPAVDHLFVEGGAETAAAFLRADLVDRLLLYRAPILIGAGKPALGDIGLDALPTAHGRWALADTRMLGNDRFEAYLRQRN